MSTVYTVLLHSQIHCYFLHKSGHARVLEKPTLILYILDSYNRKEKSPENLKSGVLMQCQHKLFSQLNNTSQKYLKIISFENSLPLVDGNVLTKLDSWNILCSMKQSNDYNQHCSIHFVGMRSQVRQLQWSNPGPNQHNPPLRKEKGLHDFQPWASDILSMLICSSFSNYKTYVTPFKTLEMQTDRPFPLLHQDNQTYLPSLH